MNPEDLSRNRTRATTTKTTDDQAQRVYNLSSNLGYQTIDDLMNLRPGTVIRFYNLQIVITDENREEFIDDLRGYLEDVVFLKAFRQVAGRSRWSPLVDFNLMWSFYNTMWRWHLRSQP